MSLIQTHAEKEIVHPPSEMKIPTLQDPEFASTFKSTIDLGKSKRIIIYGWRRYSLLCCQRCQQQKFSTIAICTSGWYKQESVDVVTRQVLDQNCVIIEPLDLIMSCFAEKRIQQHETGCT